MQSGSESYTFVTICDTSGKYLNIVVVVDLIEKIRSRSKIVTTRSRIILTVDLKLKIKLSFIIS